MTAVLYCAENERKFALKKMLMVILLLVLPFTAVGCGRRNHVGICLRYGETDASSYLETNLKDAFRSAGYQVAVWDAGNDQFRQNGQIAGALKERYDLLIVEPVMTAAAEEIITQAQLADVPVIFVNYEPEATALECWEKAYYIGSDLTQPGRLQTELVKQLPDGGDRNGDGTVACTVIAGPKDHVDAMRWTRDCGDGFLRLGTDYGDWSRDSGRTRCRRQLSNYGDSIEVIFCNSDELTLGALEALQSAEEDIYLIGIGCDAQMLERIREGVVTGTVCPNFEGIAACIAKTAAAVLRGEDAPKTQYLDFLIVTKDTVQ